MKKRLEFKIFGSGIIALVCAVIVINIFVHRMQRADVYSLSAERLAATAGIVTKGIERTMVEGKADVTRSYIKDLGSMSGFESIEVYNKDGRLAFQREAPEVAAKELSRISSGVEHISLMQKDSIVYYMPLENRPQCHSCHPADGRILGAVKLSMSLASEYNKIADFIMFLTVGSLFGVGVLGFVFWQILRRFVILPVKELEASAMKMAGGDLFFRTGINTDDEIGRLDRSIKDAVMSVSGILRRVKEVSGRIADTADSVEHESSEVVRGTQLEAEAVSDISSSMEELNSAIAEISSGAEGLAASVEETAASIEQMASTTDSLTKMTHEVSEGVDATSSSIEELSATIKEVATNAKELERVSDETLSAVDEIITSVKEVEASAKESARLSEKVKEDASTLGVNAINKTMQGMEGIRASVAKTSSVVEKLVKRSEEIGSVLNVIEEITDQTTLLALNAAILAAQAGEHGKGFSVVANEIKDLAERTDFSTQEINQLIQTIRQEVQDAVKAMAEGMSSVEEGIKLSREASEALKKILDSARKSSEMSEQIERTTTEQAKSAMYVSDAVERVRAMMEMIARATAEQSRGVTLIIEAAERMRDASHQADMATGQQAAGSKQIAMAVEAITERTRHITRAIGEQKTGTNQIWASLEKIKSIPERNRGLAFNINRELRALVKDSELVNTEMERFKLHEDEGKTIRMGVVPFVSPAELFRKFTPLASYLEREMGMRVELRIAKDFRSAVEDLRNGLVHLCVMTSITYILASREPNVRMVAQALRKGRPSHRSVIVAREGGPISSLAELKGRSVAFVDRFSASGYIVPKAMLQQEGVGLDMLSRHNFLGYHDDVVQAVLRGEFDAGGVLEASARKFEHQGLKMLKYSPDIPEFNLCAGSLDEEQVQAVRAALLKLKPDSPQASSVLRAIDEEYSGFAEGRDDDYSSIRELLSKERVL